MCEVIKLPQMVSVWLKERAPMDVWMYPERKFCVHGCTRWDKERELKEVSEEIVTYWRENLSSVEGIFDYLLIIHFPSSYQHPLYDLWEPMLPTAC